MQILVMCLIVFRSLINCPFVGFYLGMNSSIKYYPLNVKFCFWGKIKMKKIYLFGLMATSSLLFAACENNSSVNKKVIRLKKNPRSL